MRLWSIHPKYLDAKGLVALWREGLLAQAVLRGKTRGYRHHPQLERFKKHPQPKTAIAVYLAAVLAEAALRGYSFDGKKIGRKRTGTRISVTKGQLEYERLHLRRKLKKRDPARLADTRTKNILPHPLFRRVPGVVESWEIRFG